MMRFCLLALVLFIARISQAADISCYACHEAQKDDLASSIHGQSGMTCIDCHGGNPKIEDEKAHNTPDFKKAPTNKQEVAELCSRCHSDVRRMNPYGLPTDQLARYKTSKHGEQLFGKNDQKVAVCTDCHGAHDIQKSKNPTSRTYPAKIPDTCGRCHGDEKLMSQYKLPSDVVTKYKGSYHFAMLTKGDLSAPTCITCHGNHGAMPPGTQEVRQVCGKCHMRQRELFDKSPHVAATNSGKFKGCISCHSNHEIKKASVDLLDQTCSRCHSQNTKLLGLRDELAKQLRTTEAEYNKTVLKVQDAAAQGLFMDDQKLSLQEARTQFMQLEALQHSLSPAVLKPVVEQFEKTVKQTQQGVADAERYEQWKKQSLIPIMVFLLIMAVLFWLKLKEIKARKDEGRRMKDEV